MILDIYLEVERFEFDKFNKYNIAYNHYFNSYYCDFNNMAPFNWSCLVSLIKEGGK